MSNALGLVTLALTLLVLGLLAQQFRRRPRASVGCWGAGVAAYAIGVACQVAAAQGLLGGPLYRAWYLAGAFFAAAFLGAGSLFLVLRPAAAGWVLRVLLWASLLVTPLVLTAPIDLARVDPSLLSGEGFPVYVRALTPVFNIFGTIALVGVALYSGLRLARGGALEPGNPARGRLLAVVLIALGALATASGGTLLRLGVPQGFYVSQLIGIGLIGWGILPRK